MSMFFFYFKVDALVQFVTAIHKHMYCTVTPYGGLKHSNPLSSGLWFVKYK